MLRFHAIGQWQPGQVSLRWVPSTHQLSPEVSRLVDREWAAARQRLGERLFDGPVCRLESFGATPQKLELQISRSSYRLFLGTNLYHPELADTLGWPALANAIGVSTALVSADGLLILGRRNDSVAYYPNRVHPFAGALEARDPLDLFDEARRELHEELSLKATELADLCCLGLVEDALLRQPELIVMVRTSLSAAQLAAQVDRAEHHAAWPITADCEAAEWALTQTRLLSPVALTTVLLWGQQTFGQPWFERAAEPLLAR